MKIAVLSTGGHRTIAIELEPEIAMGVWYHLAVAAVDELTPLASRTACAPVEAALARALVASGYISRSTMDQFSAHMREKPADPLDKHALIAAADRLEAARERKD